MWVGKGRGGWWIGCSKGGGGGSGGRIIREGGRRAVESEKVWRGGVSGSGRGSEWMSGTLNVEAAERRRRERATDGVKADSNTRS